MNEPRSRPGTLAVTTTRRLPSSRLIWFGPVTTSTLATSARGTKPAVPPSPERSGMRSRLEVAGEDWNLPDGSAHLAPDQGASKPVSGVRRSSMRSAGTIVPPPKPLSRSEKIAVVAHKIILIAPVSIHCRVAESIIRSWQALARSVGAPAAARAIDASATARAPFAANAANTRSAWQTRPTAFLANGKKQKHV